MKRIGAKRIINSTITAGLALVALAATGACGTTPVVHELSAGANTLGQTARSAGQPTTTTIPDGVTPGPTPAPLHREQAASDGAIGGGAGSFGDWEGQRWDLGLIAQVHEELGTVGFDREQVVDRDGTLQSGPTLTGEPTNLRSRDIRNESSQLRTFHLEADPELLRPAGTPTCSGSATVAWEPFALADLPSLRRTYPQAALSFDGVGQIRRIRLLPNC